MGLSRNDFLVDLSTNIEFLKVWPLCLDNGVHYLNTALEVWEDCEDSYSYPTTPEQCYKTSLGCIKDEARKSKHWNN